MANDTYMKVAYKMYGNSSYWWIIAQFNRIPFEGDLRVGDTLVYSKASCESFEHGGVSHAC